MPNRILRDWTDSEKIENLDVHAERFFTRLIMKVDDYGRYNANVKLLKSLLYPLKSDIRETDITRWLTACEKSGLIALYIVANKEYLQIDNFKQVLRQKIEKYPAPAECDDDATQAHSVSIADDVPETKRKELEKKPEGEGGDPPHTYTEGQKLAFKNFNDFISISASAVAKMKDPFTITEFFKLKKKFSSKEIGDLVVRMGNYKPLLTKNISAYRTFLNWSERSYESDKKEVVPSGPSAAELKANEILNQVEV